MSEFKPVILSEDPVPCETKDCKKCGLYTHGSRMVWGEGNPEAPLYIILDNPGAREDKEGNPYVCGTRETLQETISVCGMDLKDIYITYILKRRPRKAYDKPWAREMCMTHLNAQLRQNPQFLVCLGNVAVQSFFDNPEAEVKHLRGDWHTVKGFPTAVSYHPLAIRRRPNLRKIFAEDWVLISKRVKREIF
ncbi:DNA polymerase [Scopulibacillus darangshiensis]|uniref:DNA polymerase n=1 Tax=Scopulibacillus darangshiensis TaxID=442528 RepID=A0A4R2NHH8_9BACL|nr:uracil-DNA glycosylase [Scopulibacillus darangshiensis]TCP20873.1 DNA polymerase [Scopulibacillus darangshiensis]